MFVAILIKGQAQAPAPLRGAVHGTREVRALLQRMGERVFGPCGLHTPPFHSPPVSSPPHPFKGIKRVLSSRTAGNSLGAKPSPRRQLRDPVPDADFLCIRQLGGGAGCALKRPSPARGTPRVGPASSLPEAGPLRRVCWNRRGISLRYIVKHAVCPLTHLHTCGLGVPSE